MNHNKLKYNLGTLAIILGVIIFLMALLNPERADFNNACVRRRQTKSNDKQSKRYG